MVLLKPETALMQTTEVAYTPDEQTSSARLVVDISMAAVTIVVLVMVVALILQPVG